MSEKVDKKRVKWNSTKCQPMDDDELKQVYGNGNSQVRYIPEEYLWAQIAKNGTGKD